MKQRKTTCHLKEEKVWQNYVLVFVLLVVYLTVHRIYTSPIYYRIEHSALIKYLIRWFYPWPVYFISHFKYHNFFFIFFLFSLLTLITQAFIFYIAFFHTQRKNTRVVDKKRMNINKYIYSCSASINGFFLLFLHW